MNGFLNVYKPVGMTSFRVISLLRRALHTKRMGHGGTLDPAARGVLPIAVGNATRLLEYVPTDKSYRADVLLGVSTDTHDAEGSVTATADPGAVTREQVEDALRELASRTTQVPPMASALHHEGKRLYELFRQGRAVDVPPRPVRIDRLVLASFDPPRLVVDVDCGGGTYVRSLARDLGDMLGCGAHLTALERTRSGPFVAEHAHLVEALLADPERILDAFVPPRLVLGALPWVPLTPEGVTDARHGKRIGPEGVEDRSILAHLTSEVCVLATDRGDLVGVGACAQAPEPCIKPLKILA